MFNATGRGFAHKCKQSMHPVEFGRNLPVSIFHVPSVPTCSNKKTLASMLYATQI